jgi:hypothetical protein
MRWRAGFLAAVVATLLTAVIFLLPVRRSTEGLDRLRVVRFEGNPIVRPQMLPGDEGASINGPSLIRVPEWVEAPLGRYYLYFAHHRGRSIRLAYADELRGPWRVHAPGALAIEETGCAQTRRRGRPHIASPDAWVDEAARRIRLYFHCPVVEEEAQQSMLALSEDGVRFAARSETLGPFYFRVFRRGGAFYAVARDGRLHRSADGIGPFEPGPQVVPASVRHAAVDVVGDTLWIYFTRVGDAPERIVRARAELAGDWTGWVAGEPEEVLAPETVYEGAGLRLAPSRKGRAREPRRELRDPFVFRDADGRAFLLYAVAGEQGIALAELAGGPSNS